MRLLNLKIDARKAAADKVEEILNRAADRDGDLTDDENSELTELRSSIEGFEQFVF